MVLLVHVEPVDGDLRLEGGSTVILVSGRVEVYFNGTWGTVCDDFWGLDDADVVCRQLGYAEARSAPIEAAYGEGTGPIFYDNVMCAGSEVRLDDCTHNGIHNCQHSEDAGVECAMLPG